MISHGFLHLDWVYWSSALTSIYQCSTLSSIAVSLCWEREEPEVESTASILPYRALVHSQTVSYGDWRSNPGLRWPLWAACLPPACLGCWCWRELCCGGCCGQIGRDESHLFTSGLLLTITRMRLTRSDNMARSNILFNVSVCTVVISEIQITPTASFISICFQHKLHGSFKPKTSGCIIYCKWQHYWACGTLY